VTKIFFIPAIGASLVYGAVANAVTPTIGEVAKLIASDGGFSDSFGYSVAVDGDTAVIGAYGDDDLGTDSGAAYVFTRDAAGVWSLQQKLTASDGASDNRFGWAVAVHGDIAVIGNESWDFFDPPPGAAYVFTRDSAGVWSEQQKLTAYDGVGGDYFGESVAVSGSTIVVGAYGDDDVGTDSGSVYVFTSDSGGTWSLQQKLTANYGTSDDWFGRSLDVDGDTTVVAAWGYDYNGTIVESGVVYVFTRDSGGVWTEQQELTPRENVDYDWYGRSVAVSGDSVAIGAYGDDQIDLNTGATYVFVRDSAGVWSEQQKLLASDAASGDNFGFSVAMDGDNLVVGAYGDDANGTDAGSAYVFTRDTTGIWSEQVKLLANDGLDYDYLGFAGRGIGISASTVVAGAPLHDTSTGANAGAGYVFDILPSADGPDITLAPSTVDFGEVMVGQTAEQIVTLSNYSTAELALFEISIASGVDFSQTNDCPATLPAAEACQIKVSFTPTLDGALSDAVTVLSDDPDQPSVSLVLLGSGITLLPDLVVTNLSVPRTLTADKLASISVTIANQGSADVTGGYWVSLYMDDILLAAEWVSDAPLVGTELEFSWSVLIPDLSSGSHILKAIVDTDDDIMELDETNNSLSKSVKIN